MALQAPQGHPKAKPIVHFPNQGRGFSFGITSRGEDGTLPEGYDRTINMTCIDGKILTPSYAIALYQQLASPVPPVAVVPWIDSNGLPYAVILAGNDAYLLKDNALTLETDATPRVAIVSVSNSGGFPLFSTTPTLHGFVAGDLVNITDSTVTAYNALAVTVSATGLTTTAFRVDSLVAGATATGNVQREAKYAGTTFWDDGAGTGYLYAGTKTGRKLLTRRTRAGVWTEPTDAPAQKGIFVTAAGGRLYKTINDYQVNSFSALTDPFTGTPSTAIYVGSSTAKITAMSNIDGRPIIAKEDGIYSYNLTDNLYNPIFPSRHDVNNFPFLAEDGAGGLYSATADGVIVHIERFGTITTIRPNDGAPGRDTPRGRIVGMACQGTKIVATMDRGGKITQPSGLVIFSTQDDLTTYINQTLNMTNQRFDQFFDISTFGTMLTVAQGGAADYILMGADDKWLLTDIVMNGANRSAARLAVQPCNVVAGALSVVSTINGATLFNGTDASPANNSTAFGQSGQISIKHSNDLSGWNTPGTLTAIPEVTTAKYWMKIGLV